MTQTAAQRTARVVVGVDRTDAHDHAVLGAAFEHARRAGADLCIVHAIPPDDQPPAAPLDAAARRRRLTARHQHIQATTADLHHRVAHRGAHHTVLYDIRYGDPATAILRAAQHADLIVVGTRGDSSHGSPLLLGPVSQDVAVHATCPVLLIPTTPPT
ncbi:universal stress protein [Dactylosporangium sp. NPDC050688]|uniref:universal stress protein n=1 Tax=Dactylosporangium sp. NPDC050688 TaxID=3157217 RepID=UPI0033EE51EF